VDYIKLINKKGGVDGYQIVLSEIETGYETPRIVEAYERTKGMGIVFAFLPYSTGGVYAVTPKAFKDKIPILHGGYGISAAAYGKAFPWNFLGAPTYWSGDAAIMKFIAEQEGGEAMLKGKKIAMVYLDIDYGRETLPFHEALIKEFGYELIKYPIPWPGLEQAAVWTDIALKTKPDWVNLRLWGMSTPTALREIDRVGYPMSRIISCPWSPTTTCIWAFDPEKSVGAKHWEFANTGTDFPIIREILTELYDKGEGAGPRKFVGIDLYNRMVYSTGLAIAALTLAAEKFGHPLDGDKIRWGWEHITPEAIKRAGVAELAPPVTLTPEDHEGGGYCRITEWDGEKFVPVSDWMAPYRHIVNALVMEAAGKFIRENPHLYR
jgi:branched-chain amino acid transport system substrate-binding protein